MKFSLVLIMCLAFATVVRAENSLAPGRVGRLKIGMSLVKIYEAYPKKLTKKIDVEHSEEDGSPIHEVHIFLGTNMDRETEKPSLAVHLERADGGITGLEVRDPRFKTADGIGVGSSLGQLRSAHKGLYFAAGEGSLSAVADDWKMAFRLDLVNAGLDEQTLKQIYANNSPWPHAKKEDPLIPDRTKITSIWVQ